MTRARLWSVGYVGRELVEVIVALRGAGVERVLDVRQLPLSRRRGFSKTPLAAALAAADIEYVHLRAAGNPYRKEATALAQYAAYLAREPQIVDEVRAAARGQRTALLCMCAETATCHRAVLARALGVTTIDV